ncbi:MAG: YggS family pyridoxal phosphate-dependent enzyme [Firmicutes bacterium]|nr:YggS family pyridoxal phosphate-dependent enzyme [Bacillota bacterium]
MKQQLELQFNEVRNRIQQAAKRAGGQAVKLVGVTKTVPVERIEEAMALGLMCFGESRVQEAMPKLELFPQAEWHFIGRLQTNKVKNVVGKFSLIHSLDRWKLALALQREAEKLETTVRALVQVNIGREKQKGGLDPLEVEDFLSEAGKLSRLKIEGLMAVPPYSTDPEDARPYFREMYQLFTKIRVPGVQMKILSLGMSNDFEIAIEEGANLVRVGSLLFGKRS